MDRECAVPQGTLSRGTGRQGGGGEGSSEGEVLSLSQPPLRLGWPFRVVPSWHQEPGLCAPGVDE